MIALFRLNKSVYMHVVCSLRVSSNLIIRPDSCIDKIVQVEPYMELSHVHMHAKWHDMHAVLLMHVVTQVELARCVGHYVALPHG